MNHKMRKRLMAFILFAALTTGLCTFGVQAQPQADHPAEESTQAETNKIVDEGVDTPVEVTGYHEYHGSYKDMFLKEGDKIAVISPSAMPSCEQVDATVEGLRKWGYVPVEGKYVCTEVRTVENCREDLEWALNAPEIKAVFCVRGGYASTEVLDILPPETIASAKKLIIGYSDISAYHSAWTVSHLPSVHASMSAAFTDLSEECVQIQQAMMKGQIPTYECAGSGYDIPGTAQGVLIGGNLTVYKCVLGTDYSSAALEQPYILFLEDVGSNLLNVHADLTLLRNLGVLEHASGIIFGEWTDFELGGNDYSGDSRGGIFTSAADMIYRQFLKDLDIPVAFGFPAGHGENNYPLLMGEELKLTVTDHGYILEWSDGK